MHLVRLQESADFALVISESIIIQAAFRIKPSAGKHIWIADGGRLAGGVVISHPPAAVARAGMDTAFAENVVFVPLYHAAVWTGQGDYIAEAVEEPP